MTGLSALNLPQPLVWILAFAIIFGLLAAFAHLLKRIAGSRAAELEGGRNRVPRLGLVDSFDLDRHRKLIIVRRDNVEHLLLVGPSDVVVEANIVRVAGATPREERVPTIAAMPAGPSMPLGPSSMPIPPAPATPQAMQAPTKPDEAAVSPAAIPPAAAPTMPSAPFPVPPPVRPQSSGKSAMPPPPPFGAPKRGTSAPNPRVEPILTSIIGGGVQEPAEKAPSVDKTIAAAPVAPVVPQKAAAPVEEKRVEEKRVEEKRVEEKRIEEKPAALPDLPVPKVTPMEEPAATIAEPAPKLTEPAPPQTEIFGGVDSPVAPPERKPVTAALSPDLSAKLEDVLKVKITPDAGVRADAPRAPLPPLPPLPPLAPAKPIPQANPVSPLPPENGFEPPRERAAPAGATTEIAHTPKPITAEAPAPAIPPAPPVDAFEEELRRILGRAPQKG